MTLQRESRKSAVKHEHGEHKLVGDLRPRESPILETSLFRWVQCEQDGLTSRNQA